MNFTLHTADAAQAPENLYYPHRIVVQDEKHWLQRCAATMSARSLPETGAALSTSQARTS